jgi:autotransporter-associated beta strand protein
VSSMEGKGMFRRTCPLCLLLAVGLLVSAARPVTAQTDTWTGAVSTFWSNAGNWTTVPGPNRAPINGDTVVLNGTPVASNVPFNYDLNVTLASVTLNAQTGSYDLVRSGAGGNIGLQSGGFVTDKNIVAGFFGDIIQTGLTLNGPATITFAGGPFGLAFNTNPITGTGPLTLVNSSGTNDNLELQIANTYTGATIIGAGNRVEAFVNGAIPTTSALTVNGSMRFLDSSTIGSLAGGGNVFMLGTLTTGGDNTSTTYSGVLADDPNGDGAASLTKTGTGTMTLTGANTYTGVTTVNGGTLVVNGSIATSSLTTVNAAGTLAGIGVVGPTIVNGTISPGPVGGIGTLNVMGAFMQNAGSTFLVNTAGAASNQLQITGAATINGGTVVANGSGAPDTVYTILTATGGRFGAFDGFVDNIPGTTADLLYDANNVYLVLLPVDNDIVEPLPGRTRPPLSFNEASVLRALTGPGASIAFLRLIEILASETNAQVRFTLNQLSGEIYASNVSAGLENQNLFLRTLAARLRQSQCLCGRDAAAPGCDSDEAWQSWGTPFGQAGKASGDGNAHGFGFDSVGFAAGAETWLLGGTKIGFAVGYDNWQNNTDEVGSRSSSNSFLLGLYGRQQIGDGWLLGVVSYENDSCDTTRPIDVLAATARSSSGLNQAGSYLEAGCGIGVAGLQIQPIGALQYISLWRNSVSESGAGTADLDVRGGHADSVCSIVGGRLAYPLTVAGQCLLPEVRAFWMHEYAANTRDIDNQFVAGDPEFQILGRNLARNRADFGLGLSMQVGSRLRIGLQYDALIDSVAVVHGCWGQAQLAW